MYTSCGTRPGAEIHFGGILSEMPDMVKASGRPSPTDSEQDPRPATKCRILLVDRHTLFLEAVQSLLQTDYDVTCLTFDGPHAVLTIAARIQPDILVLNPMVDGLNHVGLVRQVREQTPSTKVLYLAENASLPLAAAAFTNGVSGFLVKNSSVDDLMKALCSLRHEQPFLDSQLADGNIDTVRRFHTPLVRLTPREVEVLGLLLRGWSMKQVARELNVTPRTVAYHKYRAMQILEVQNNAALIEAAGRLGLLGP